VADRDRHVPVVLCGGDKQRRVIREARYDRIADWYPAWVGDGDGLIADGVGDLLPPELTGQSVVDVACGHGRSSRALARRGAQVTGVDISRRLIDLAQARDLADCLGITYRVADFADLASWWNGTPFDGAVCEMAMMDIDDLDATVSAVATVVRPDGWFAASLVHPCFPGNDAGLSSWPPERTYFDEGRWTSADHNPDGVRLRVGSSHRTLSTYFNSLIAHGFQITRIFEPPAEVPMILAVRCDRAPATERANTANP
jgi:SAM-dependent methyltransferase